MLTPFQEARGLRVSVTPTVRQPAGQRSPGAVVVGELTLSTVIVTHLPPTQQWCSLQWITGGTQVRVRRVKTQSSPQLEPGEWECVEGTILRVDWPAIVLDALLVWSVVERSPSM